MGMSFLSPLLLWGTALIAAPVILHLIMRRKPVPHSFPALRFLQQRAVANRRRLRVNHLLLLLLRIAAIALLALALARPVLRGAGWLPESEGPVAAAFVFDTAPRMMLREGNQTRLERAKAMAKVLFSKLPSGSQVAVFDTAGTPAAFTQAAAAEARIDRLSSASPDGSLPAAIAAARRLLDRAELERREIYVFTDCSQGAWGQAVARDTEDPAADVGPSTLYCDVSSLTPRNFAIESVALAGERIAGGTPLVVTTRIGHVGPDATRQAAVEMVAPDGRFVRRGAKAISPTGGRPETARFEIRGLPPGIHQGRVVLDGSDDLAADDTSFFTVEVGSPSRVIVASAAPARRTGRLMVEALAPAALRKAGTARFAPEPVDFSKLDATNWQQAAGIVLLDPPAMKDHECEALAAWVAEGHGLVVWLGPAAAGGAAGFNTAASRRLFGGELVRVWRSPDAGNYLAPTSLDHPVLAAFRRVGDAVPWQDFPVFRHWEFLPTESTGEKTRSTDDKKESKDETKPGDDDRKPAVPLAAYRNGLPAILEHRIGEGRVVLVTTPVGFEAASPDAWNLLATGFEPWPFVILANETVLSAIDTTATRNVVAGRAVVIPLGRRDLPTAIVHTPGGEDFPVAIDRARGTATVTATLEPGNYTVRAGGVIGGVADGFSVVLDPAAIDFRRLTPDQLAAVLGPKHRLARTEEELVRDMNLERIGSELFGWMIVLAAVAMAADWIVANRFYAPRKDMEPPPDAAVSFAAEAKDEAAEAHDTAIAWLADDATGSRAHGSSSPPPVAGARP
jgi:hypothetical protein